MPYQRTCIGLSFIPFSLLNSGVTSQGPTSQPCLGGGAGNPGPGPALTEDRTHSGWVLSQLWRPAGPDPAGVGRVGSPVALRASPAVPLPHSWGPGATPGLPGCILSGFSSAPREVRPVLFLK